MNLFENLQSMNEDIKRAEELVDRNVLRDSGIEFYENGRGELIVKTIDDPIPLEVEVEQNDGKWFVTLPSEDIYAASNDLTDAIIKAVNQIDDMPPQMTPGCKSKLNEFTTEEKTEAAIVKDEKDIEQIVEGTQTLTEDSDNILDLVEAKSKRFGAMVDAIGEDMPTSEVNDFLKGLTTELDMDVYEGDKPYPTDLAGYFGQPVDELDINNSDDLEMINWIDGILTECIDKMNTFITSRIEILRGEISAIEGDIARLELVL